MEAVVAVDENWGIGKNGALLFRISADLKRFKELTTGKTVILGRKTLATFPGGKPLPNRTNFVLSTSISGEIPGAKVFKSLKELLACAPPDSVVIGGQRVYEELLDRCQRVYVTKVAGGFPADAWFPNLDRRDEWKIVETQGPFTEKDLTFSFVTYEREG